MHKWACSYEHLIYKDSQRVPIYWLSMTLIHDYLWGQVLWGPANSVRALIITHSLYEAEVGQF